MEKISISLYGGKGIFGGKETPLEADVIYCDKYENCSFYKENKCLNHRSFLAPYCKFGKVETIKGYTSRAKKYYDFKSKYSNDEKYSLLSYPSNLYIGIVDGFVLLKIPFISISKENNKYAFETPFSSRLSVLLLDEFDLNIIERICRYSPHALTGGVITDYAEKHVPEFLRQLKIILPDIYSKFIEEHPEFDKAPNYIGKYAYIKTMVDGSTLCDCHGNRFILKNKKLYCENMKKGFIPFDGIFAKVEVEVGDRSTYKIDDNSQCNENTKFE